MSGRTLFTLQQALPWLSGAQLVGAGGTAVLRVHTDTRTLAPGDLFVAIAGERFDAHDFLPEAAQRGAAAAIAQRGLAAAGLAGLQVADSRIALGELAAAWRAQFSLPLIAVTGSNGKTTVTQMIASILRAAWGDAAFATEGNFNNDIGLPLTLLRLNAQHRAGVVELGMNHPGEIALLARMARPTVALVNNAQREHQEFMASVEAVAHENGNVIGALAADGTAVFPADDAYADVWRALAAKRPCIRFALEGAADVSLRTAAWADGAWQVRARTPAGDADYRLQIAGRHNVKNSLAALAAALAAGISLADIARGLSAFEPVKGRSRALAMTVGPRQLTVVDDTYNANPDSVRAAIDVLAELPGPRLLVLGDMGEVGDQGPAFHLEVGAHARARGIERVFTLGSEGARTVQGFGEGRHFGDDIDALNAAVLEAVVQTAPGTGPVESVLVKGSRFMKMERVVQSLAQKTQELREDHHAS